MVKQCEQKHDTKKYIFHRYNNEQPNIHIKKMFVVKKLK